MRRVVYILPFVVYVPLFLGSRVACVALPTRFDWGLLALSALLVCFNPVFKRSGRIGTQVALSACGVVLCGSLLWLLSFVMMAIVFHEAL